ncbi:MAG: helix-turn-helix domain-containing protein [Acidimicrobiia bacterium]|jgi:protein-tyrosine-phosphatase/DNA-binding transcriptional ArsR family regulator
MDIVDRARVHAALGDETRLRMVEALWLNDHTPLQLRRLVGIDSNLVSHHLDVLEQAGVIVRRVSAGDARRRYVTVDVDVVRGLVPERGLAVESVVFVCTHNSARSQFAAALLSAKFPIKVESAGMSPSPAVHPKAVRVAGEHGLDIAKAVPKSYEEVEREPDLLVSVCDRACEASLPFRTRRFHWSIADPVETGRIDGFRSAFEDISRRVELLAAAIEMEET